MANTKSVGIFGGGIAGLSCAHELSLPSLVGDDYDIHVYEASDSFGGQAKSYRDPKNNLPTEISWRGYGAFYKNVYECMKNIPSPEDKNLTVYDTELSRPIQFLLCKDDVRDIDDAYNWTKSFTLQDKIILMMILIKVMIVDKRSSECYSKISATDYLDSTNINPRTLTYIKSVFGPWIGITGKASLHHVVNFFRMIRYPDLNKPFKHPPHSNEDIEDGGEWEQKSDSRWSVLRRPSNEAWFDPWVSKLTKNNVKFHTNSLLYKINAVDGKIINMDIQSLKGIQTVVHDYYVIATTPFAVTEITQRSSLSIRMDPQFKLFKNLTKDGIHIQVAFTLGYNKLINTPEKFIAFILPDSEFNLTFIFENKVWHKNINLGENIISLISGTACIAYQKGKLYDKPLTLLTKDEFQKEILYQLYKCDNLNEIIAKSNKGNGLNKFNENIHIFEVWKGWNFSPKGLAIDPNERKWINSIHTNEWMPTIQTSFHNVFLAGAHVKSSIDLYSMETACCTGRDAAFLIIKDGESAFRVNKPLWMRTIGSIDNGLYNLYLPNIVDMSLVIIVVVIIYIFMFKK